MRLFRFELESALRPGGERRLVPAPFRDDIGGLPLSPFAAPPGSYLFVLSKAGFEELLLPFLLARGGRFEGRAQMLEEGSTPEGFIWITPGPFIYGGDPEALRSGAREVLDLPGYWIGRDEVTVEDYLEFVNDPATMREIGQARAEGRYIYVPRDSENPEGAWPLVDGAYCPGEDPRLPVNRITWEDAKAYCRWRTERARERGEAWTYDLPSEEEWEKAARGADGRWFPWGDEFDWSFCRGAWSLPGTRQPAFVGSFALGASPWGARDMAGNAMEWCQGDSNDGASRSVRGGAWMHASSMFFRCAYRSYATPRFVGTAYGLRLAAHAAESP